jgi:DNA-binding GntR family transcriptional regulator
MQHRSAQDICYGHLREEIATGRMPSGARIITDKVAQQLGLSRMPVREALRQLDAEGLVTIRPNRGAVVTSLAPDAVAEILEMRGVLEGLAARHAARRAAPLDIEDLDALAAAMRRAVTDADRWSQRHEEFHDRVCTLSGRPRLAAEARRLRLAVRPYTRLYADRHSEPEALGHEHELIVDALRDRDARRAERLVVAHVAANAAAMLSLLGAGHDAARPKARVAVKAPG